MKPTIRLIIIGAILGAGACVLATFAGCATTSKVISTAKDCADQVTHSVAAGILDDVSSVLVCDSGDGEKLPACVVAQLGAIAAKAGWSAIDCVLAEIRQKASDNVMASGDTTENLRARRATAAIAWRAAQNGSNGP